MTLTKCEQCGWSLKSHSIDRRNGEWWILHPFPPILKNKIPTPLHITDISKKLIEKVCARYSGRALAIGVLQCDFEEILTEYMTTATPPFDRDRICKWRDQQGLWIWPDYTVQARKAYDALYSTIEKQTPGRATISLPKWTTNKQLQEFIEKIRRIKVPILNMQSDETERTTCKHDYRAKEDNSKHYKECRTCWDIVVIQVKTPE